MVRYYSMSLAWDVTSVFIRGLLPQAPEPLTVRCGVQQLLASLASSVFCSIERSPSLLDVCFPVLSP